MDEWLVFVTLIESLHILPYTNAALSINWNGIQVCKLRVNEVVVKFLELSAHLAVNIFRERSAPGLARGRWVIAKLGHIV